MLGLEYVRYLLSRGTIVIMLTLLSTSVIGFVISHNEKQEFVGSLATYTEDSPFDLKLLQYAVNSYGDTSFLYNLWFNSDIPLLLVLVIIAWIGIYFVPRMQIEKRNNFGNLILSRVSFGRRVLDILGAQSLYIMTIIVFYVLITTILAMVWGGVTPSHLLVEMYGLNRWDVLVVIGLQAIWLSIAVISMNAFAFMADMYIKNKYILQIIPIIIFVILPMLAGTAIGNTFPEVGEILLRYQPTNLIDALHFFFQESWDSSHWIWNGAIVWTSFVAFLVLFPFYYLKGRRDYL